MTDHDEESAILKKRRTLIWQIEQAKKYNLEELEETLAELETEMGGHEEAERREAHKPQWVAEYWHHYTKYREPEDSLADAYGTLYYGQENGELSPIGIHYPDGRFVEYADDDRRQILGDATDEG